MAHVLHESSLRLRGVTLNVRLHEGLSQVIGFNFDALEWLADC